MENSKNIIAALILSTLILIVWQQFYLAPRIEEVDRIQAKKEEAKKASIESDNIASGDKAKKPKYFDNRNEAIEQNKRIKISNDRLHGSISLKGARIDDLTLINYKQENSPDSPEVVLLSPSNTKEFYFAEFGWISKIRGVPMPNSSTIWYSEQDTLSANSPVTLTWDNNSGLKFVINIAIDDNYMFEISRTVVNYGLETQKVIPYGLINRSKDLTVTPLYILHEGPLGVFDNILLEETYSDLKDDKEFIQKNTQGWLGMTDKYWLTTIIPEPGNSFDAKFSYSVRDNLNVFQTDYLGRVYDIEPNGGSISIKEHFFAGAKKVHMLDEYAKDLGVPLFDRAVDFGVLYFLTKPTFTALTFFHALTGNFGLAILLLTVVIKLILFPLANKSYVSMHKMKSVHPQLLEIKERFKDNKVQMNKEVMELYKREKINPVSGCLPIFVQIPVFFALYKVLFVTIEMRHAPFFGWITDLSEQDPTSIFNLFGLMPWDAPSFLVIGAWPIIMGATMVLQQKMNPQPADPVQAKIMMYLPYFFTLLFYTFPAGLVIYWAWNNILSISQQWLITRRLPVKTT